MACSGEGGSLGEGEGESEGESEGGGSREGQCPCKSLADRAMMTMNAQIKIVSCLSQSHKMGLAK